MWPWIFNDLKCPSKKDGLQLVVNMEKNKNIKQLFLLNLLFPSQTVKTFLTHSKTGDRVSV